jgi:hypothetical protein
MRLHMSSRHSNDTTIAAAKAGISTATGYRIEADPRLPSQRRAPRGRRRPDPLADVWDSEIVPILKAAPGLRAIAVLAEIRRRHLEIGPGIRRTLERRIRTSWRSRALHGRGRWPDPNRTSCFGRSIRPAVSGYPTSPTRLNSALRLPVSCSIIGSITSGWRSPGSRMPSCQVCVPHGVVLGGESFVALAEGLQNALWARHVEDMPSA